MVIERTTTFDENEEPTIAFYTTSTVNWGMASALGLLLLVATLALYAVYARLVGADRMRLG